MSEWLKYTLPAVTTSLVTVILWWVTFWLNRKIKRKSFLFEQLYKIIKVEKEKNISDLNIDIITLGDFLLYNSINLFIFPCEIFKLEEETPEGQWSLKIKRVKYHKDSLMKKKAYLSLKLIKSQHKLLRIWRKIKKVPQIYRKAELVFCYMKLTI